MGYTDGNEDRENGVLSDLVIIGQFSRIFLCLHRSEEVGSGQLLVVSWQGGDCGLPGHVIVQMGPPIRWFSRFWAHRQFSYHRSRQLARPVGCRLSVVSCQLSVVSEMAAETCGRVGVANERKLAVGRSSI